MDQEQDQKPISGAPAPVTSMIVIFFLTAIKEMADEIHIEIMNEEICIHFYGNGEPVCNSMQLPVALKNLIIARLKVMAALDISERQGEQDGHIEIHFGECKVATFSVRTEAGEHGENVLMKLVPGDLGSEIESKSKIS